MPNQTPIPANQTPLPSGGQSTKPANSTPMPANSSPLELGGSTSSWAPATPAPAAPKPVSPAPVQAPVSKPAPAKPVATPPPAAKPGAVGTNGTGMPGGAPAPAPASNTVTDANNPALTPAALATANPNPDTPTATPAAGPTPPVVPPATGPVDNTDRNSVLAALSAGLVTPQDIATHSGLSVDDVNQIMSDNPQFANQAAENKLTNDTQSAIATNQANINAIQNGSIPLSPDESAQLDGINQQYDALKTQQATANANYQGGTNINEIRSGRQEFMNNISSGNYQQAVNDGLAKMTKLTGDANTAIAALKQSFKTNDMANAAAQYKSVQDSLAARATQLASISKLTDSLVTSDAQAIKDAQTRQDTLNQQKFTNTLASDAATRQGQQDAFNNLMATKNLDLTTAQDAVNNLMNSQKFTYQEKQDAIKNALDATTLSDKEKQQIFDNEIKTQDEKLKTDAAAFADGTGNNGGVTLGSTGIPNKGQQAAFLANYSPAQQTQIKGLANYSMNPSDFSVKGGQRAAMVTMAQQYDPTYDDKQYAVRSAFLKDYTSGQVYNSNIAMNTAITHLGALKQASDSLQHAQFGGLFGIGTHTYNTVGDMLKNESGDPRVKTLNYAIDQVSTEIAKAYKGGAPSETEIAAEKANFEGMSPAQANSLVGEAVNLLGDKLGTVRDSYTNTMGKPPTNNILSDISRQTLNQLQSQGVNVDANKIDPITNYTSLKQFYQADPANAEQVKTLRAQFPGKSDQDILDYVTGNATASDAPPPSPKTSVGSDTNTGAGNVVAKATACPDNSTGGQCGHFVNQLTGLGLGDSYASKAAKMDKSITTPAPGMVFIMPYKDTGHTGIIVSVKNGMATVKDSNYYINSKPGKIATHQIPVSKMTGFAVPKQPVVA